MSSGARITAAFLLGAGLALALAGVAVAAGILAAGEASGGGAGALAAAGVLFATAGVASVAALRRGQLRAETRVLALGEKVLRAVPPELRGPSGGAGDVEATIAAAQRACEALGDRVAALQRSAAELSGGEGGPLLQLAEEARARGEAIAEALAQARTIRDATAARMADAEALGERIRDGAEVVSRMDGANARGLETIAGLAASVEQAALATKEGDKASRAIARELDNLSAGVRTARASLEVMKDGAGHACADARHVANTMASLELESQRIGGAVEAVISGSDAVLASNDRILGATESLESRLGGIDDVIGVIRNLADRTKLLSINASIIATEAGEHGRAFAVVANEIKDLAASTSRAIAEISSILSTLKDGFGETVQAIALSREDVGRGLGIARGAVEMIRSIPEQVHVTSALSNEIVMRNEEQVKKGVELGAMFERIAAALEQLEELLQRQVMRDEAAVGMYLAIGRSSDHAHRSAKELVAVSAEAVRAMRNVFDTYSETMKRAAGGVGAADGLVQKCGEAAEQVERLRGRAAAACSRLSEIVQLSREVGGAREP